ncbi:MAG: hypothetical protein AAFX99_19275 [Myxococcota bacterium]
MGERHARRCMGADGFGAMVLLGRGRVLKHSLTLGLYVALEPWPSPPNGTSVFCSTELTERFSTAA